MMAQAQKPDFFLRRNGRMHLNRQGRQLSRLLAAEVCASAVVMLFRGSVKGTGYPLHSPVSPSLPLPCVTVYHHISTGLCRGGSTFIGYVTVNVLEMERKRLVVKWRENVWW